MPTPTAKDLLRATELFRGLGDGALAALGEGASRRSLSRGEIVFREGDEGEALYIVIDGSVKVSVSSQQGEDLVLTTLGPGDAFGELPLIDEGPRSASAVALSPTILLALDRRTLLDAAQRDPQLLDGLLRSLGRLVRRLTEQAADLVFLDLHTRVAKLLLRMAEKEAATEDGVVILDKTLTQTDLAEMVGGSRQSVNQALHALEHRGFIEVRGREIRVVKMQELAQRAGT